MGTLNLTDEERRNILEAARYIQTFPLIINHKPYFVDISDFAIFAAFTKEYPAKYFKKHPEIIDGVQLSARKIDSIMWDIIDKYRETVDREETFQCSSNLTMYLYEHKNQDKVMEWYRNYPRDQYPESYL